MMKNSNGTEECGKEETQESQRRWTEMENNEQEAAAAAARGERKRQKPEQQRAEREERVVSDARPPTPICCCMVPLGLVYSQPLDSIRIATYGGMKITSAASECPAFRLISVPSPGLSLVILAPGALQLQWEPSEKHYG
ncbi:uncharacterized protein BO80DRAFT_229221 [Aspergillus ibericus CBS 121593]|uniref:Uncharacterized protein n=1 Tax=Aspergillus ibericus CBS 121593 TaxID=1448316 RepID=A0A395GQQ7_9EURO|nr:hypothetical protein BO80DRAFT_229221 [Aspergillus ibericus CBS 121593]RAK96403.1 hypothetical protein BO80DRAFT_229221 [Aspergillus ibericus CBS 121593]